MSGHVQKPYDTQPDGTHDRDLYDRCARALRRAQQRRGLIPQQPSISSAWREGAYELSSSRGTLARFKIRSGRIACVEPPQG